jgi:hypothetical protein
VRAVGAHYLHAPVDAAEDRDPTVEEIATDYTADRHVARAAHCIPGLTEQAVVALMRDRIEVTLYRLIFHVETAAAEPGISMSHGTAWGFASPAGSLVRPSIRASGRR